jgi:hypothetical protein
MASQDFLPAAGRALDWEPTAERRSIHPRSIDFCTVHLARINQYFYK